MNYKGTYYSPESKQYIDKKTVDTMSKKLSQLIVRQIKVSVKGNNTKSEKRS